MEQKHIDATIRSLTDEVPGKPGLCCPWLMPGDGALLKQGGDTFGNTVIRLIFHGIFLWLFVVVKEPCEPTTKRMPRRKIKVGGAILPELASIKKGRPDGSPLCCHILLRLRISVSESGEMRNSTGGGWKRTGLSNRVLKLRTYDDGKKIGAMDAVSALWVILRCYFTRDIYVDRGAKILDSLAGTKRFNKWMADTVRPMLGTRVLELGAGIGNMTQHLARGRKIFVASDIDQEHLARLRVRFRGRPNLEIRKCDLCDVGDFQAMPGVFDSVVCLNVVEHVEDDSGALRNIFAALRPGGRAIILVPQDQKAYGTLDEVLGHYRRYSEGELRARMEEAGFEVERVLHFNRVTRPAWRFNGQVLKRRSFGRLQLRIFDALVPLWRRIDRYLPWPAVSVIAVGRVPGGGESTQKS